MQESDQELIERYLNGEEEFFAVLMNRYIKYTYNFIIRLSGDKNVSDDLLQETFLKVWKNLRHFDTDKKFSTWILAIARNTVIDWQRKNKAITFSQLDTPEESFANTLVGDLPSPEEIFDQKFLREKFDEEVAKLSGVEQTILLLHLEDDLTFAEICEVIDKPLNTVKSLYRRSLEKIKSRWPESLI
jgi:RNA polymerase sigma-70 factor (ECF subfamily)